MAEKDDNYLKPLILDGTAVTIPQPIRDEMDLSEDDMMMIEKAKMLPEDSRESIRDMAEELKDLANENVPDEVEGRLEEMADELGDGVSGEETWAFFPTTVMKKD